MTVLVVGNAAVDTAFEVARLPRPGESILAAGLEEGLGGKGLNQAVAAARAGARVSLCAPVGSDWAADAIERGVRAEGIDPGGLVRSPGASDRSIVCVMPGGENAIVTSADRARSLQPEDATAAIDRLGPGDVLLLQGNLSPSTTLACAELARQRGATVALNPSPVTMDFGRLWPFSDLAILNAAECRELSGRSALEAGARHLVRAGVGTVVVTRGAAGIRVVDATSSTTVPAPRVRAVDTTGAGDLLCGVLVAGLAEGMEVLAACRWAVAGASIAVTRRGASAAFPSATELKVLRPPQGPG